MPSRTNFLPRYLAGALLVSVPVVSACGARIVPLGSTGETSDKLTSLDPGDVASSASTIGACPAGYAHPNICCEAAANETATCGAWQEDPFRACATGWTTYPNSLSCCSLSNPTDCIDTPGDAGAGTASPPSYGCGFSCSPGWYPASGITPAGSTVTCCRTFANGTSECTGTGPSTPISTPACSGTTLPVTTDAGVGPTDGGAAYDAAVDEAGLDEAGAPLNDCDASVTDPYPGYDGGAASLCAPCPSGWSTDSNDPLLCCRESQSNGVLECFSQATGAVTGSTSTDDDGGVTEAGPGPGDGGVTIPLETDASVPPSSSFCTATLSDSCSCQLASGGHTYELDCSAPDSTGKTSCSCFEDGAVTTQFTTGQPECADTTYASGDYLNICGFPEP